MSLKKLHNVASIRIPLQFILFLIVACLTCEVLSRAVASDTTNVSNSAPTNSNKNEKFQLDTKAIRDDDDDAVVEHQIKQRQINFSLDTFLDGLFQASAGVLNGPTANGPTSSVNDDAIALDGSINPPQINLIAEAGIPEIPAPTQKMRLSMNSGLRR